MNTLINNQRTISDTNTSFYLNQQDRAIAPIGYLTKSRYILNINQNLINQKWPKLLATMKPIIELIIDQPFEFDKGTSNFSNHPLFFFLIIVCDNIKTQNSFY